MPTLTYGGRHGENYELTVADDLLAVRTRGNRSLSGPAVPLDDMDVVLSFPEAGVEVYRDRAGRSAGEMAEALRAAPDVRFAGRVLVDEVTREPVVYTENIFVKFRDDVPADVCRSTLGEAGLRIKTEPGYAANAFFTAAPEGTGQEVFAIAQRLLERSEVEYAHPEVVRRLGRRTIAPQQWHLATRTIGGRAVTASANVAEAHTITRGAGVTIAVIDDGVDLDHEEFASPGKIVAPRDTTGGDGDPRPHPRDGHGTACAGVACADGRHGASGVAPEAKLMPIRMMSHLGSQAEADAFHWAATHGADVVSCSWGPADGDWADPDDPQHRARSPLPDSTRLAIDHAVSRGRGGKGCLIMFAAGNGNESVDLDGYASYAKVVAVAACNDRGRRSVYSDKGDALFCAFPSSDFAFAPEGRPEPLTPGIWTTDISGRGGYGAGKYVDSFGGTSSACPGAAGVAALVLARDPALTWTEVKQVLRRSSDRIDAERGGYSPSGHSKWYGYGRLNAGAAIRLAGAPDRSGGTELELEVPQAVSAGALTTA